MDNANSDKLQRLASFSKDFLEAADFPPYYRDGLGIKVARAASFTDQAELETLRRKLVGARIGASLEDVCRAQINLAEAFLKAADLRESGRAFSLIPRAACTAELADALQEANAPTLALYVRNKSSRPLL